MRAVYIGVILLLALIAFALQPTKGKPIPVDISALRAFPLTLGSFHAVSQNDAELAPGLSVTDGSVGLDRTYVDNNGRRFEMVVIPQTIGQHVPVLCDRYGGYTIVSETQMAMPENPQVRFNRLTLHATSGNADSTCNYFWKTANGSFVPKPNHSLGVIAARWSEHQQGLFVNICSEDIGKQGAGADLAGVIEDSYIQAARLYPAVFRIPTKD